MFRTATCDSSPPGERPREFARSGKLDSLANTRPSNDTAGPSPPPIQVTCSFKWAERRSEFWALAWLWCVHGVSAQYWTRRWVGLTKHPGLPLVPGSCYLLRSHGNVRSPFLPIDRYVPLNEGDPEGVLVLLTSTVTLSLTLRCMYSFMVALMASPFLCQKLFFSRSIWSRSGSKAVASPSRWAFACPFSSSTYEKPSVVSDIMRRERDVAARSCDPSVRVLWKPRQ